MARPIPEVVCNRGAIDSIRHGHPWVWRSAVGQVGTSEAGAEVLLVDGSGTALGRGVYDPESPIAVRIWTQGREPIDHGLFVRRIARAFAIRRRLFDATTTAYRLLHGEGDRMPGIVVDRYGSIAVFRADGPAALAWLPKLAPALEEALARIDVITLVVRHSERADRGQPRLQTVFGPAPPATVNVTEHGVPFVVDLVRGQKTGAFLDQRENRRRVGQLARGRTVCNLFSYAGGFSLHAALGGASKVTSVDIAAGAHATAQESFALAHVDARAHEFITADVFEYLARSRREGRSWDLVISDPPSFAPSEKALPRALAGYRALHRACADVLAPDGIFCASSCSSHVDATAFAATLDDAALGRSDLRLLELFGPPADHPTLPSWPEGRYLKFGVLE
jgi:23S rRNA (cytosine1962-C5)-methyltransferase